MRIARWQPGEGGPVPEALQRNAVQLQELDAVLGRVKGDAHRWE